MPSKFVRRVIGFTASALLFAAATRAATDAKKPEAGGKTAAGQEVQPVPEGSPAPDSPSVNSAGADKAIPEDPPVGAEDLLEISVFEIPDLTRIVRVTEHGTISLPLLGEIIVRGLTPMELEDRLRDELSKKYLENPQVSVFVKEHGSKKVSVLGAVGKPGVYEMLGARTLLQMLSEAGGLTKEVGSELYVIRDNADGGIDKIPVNVLDLMTGRGDPSLNLAIAPGDIVTVPMDRPIYIYVDGAVKTPGRLDEVASRPITLGQAIAKAGGATDRANLKAIQILRKGKDGEQTTLTANLTRIRKGKDPDQVLQDGDVVVVPETFF